MRDCWFDIDRVPELLEVVLDRHLQSRPTDYLVAFRALLAVEEEHHWANALEGFRTTSMASTAPTVAWG